MDVFKGQAPYIYHIISILCLCLVYHGVVLLGEMCKVLSVYMWLFVYFVCVCECVYVSVYMCVCMNVWKCSVACRYEYYCLTVGVCGDSAENCKVWKLHLQVELVAEHNIQHTHKYIHIHYLCIQSKSSFTISKPTACAFSQYLTLKWVAEIIVWPRLTSSRSANGVH